MIKSALWVITLLVVTGVCDSDDSHEEYIDPVIDMLLNGVDEKVTEDAHNDEPTLGGGIWKCGNCTDLGEAKLVHSETNLVEDTDEQVDVQITLKLPYLRCVTVTSDQPGAVRQVIGTCEGTSVTLAVSSSHNFTILVYT